MSVPNSSGMDPDGYILSISQDPIQPEFQPLLEDVRASLSQEDLGLDGVYLYGSVARADATPGISDLDLTLVLREPPTAPRLARLEEIRRALEQRHSEVIKVDFDIGSRGNVLAPENLHRWGFWLKHHCRCLWGNDLSLHFERFRPSRDIAVALNADVEQVLAGYLTRIAQTDAEQDRLRLQREASRKIVRATHVLRSEDATTWPQTLEEHVALFVRRYPTMITQVAFFLFEARNPQSQVDNFTTRLQGFMEWMAAQAPKG